MTHFRSSHQKCSMQIGVLRNFTKFIGKHLCQSFFFNKVPGLRPATLLKKRLWHRYFPMNFVRFLTTPFLLTPLVVASIVWKMKGVTKFSDFRKQPSRGVLRKRCSENMPQIYRRTPIPKCDFNKVALQRKATLLKSHFGIGILL